MIGYVIASAGGHPLGCSAPLFDSALCGSIVDCNSIV